MKRKDPRRELARKLSGAKLKEPPELCTRCVWAMHESGCPVRMERRQRRAYVTAELGGVARRVRFGIIPVDGDAQ